MKLPGDAVILALDLDTNPILTAGAEMKTEIKLDEALKRFNKEADSKSITAVVGSLRGFILLHASRWLNSGLCFADRCKELLSEVFLILIEDFKFAKLAGSATALAYLGLRIRRLTRPRNRIEAVPFGLSGDMPDSGRSAFTPSKLNLTEVVTGVVRSCLAAEKAENTRILEFLFMHVNPEIAWASRFIAQAVDEDLRKRIEADKKRHSRFHRTLKTALEQLDSFDLSEISSWSAGERSHLAWKIISFSPAEAALAGEEASTVIDRWRENPNEEIENHSGRMTYIRCSIDAIRHYAVGKPPDRFVACEEPADYGEPFNILNFLLKPGCSSLIHPGAMETTLKWDDEDQQLSQDQMDKAFNLAAEQVGNWVLSFAKALKKTDEAGRYSRSSHYPPTGEN